MLEEIRKETLQFLNDIKENIKNPEDLNYIFKRTELLTDEVLKQMEKILNYKEAEINKLQKKQKEHDEKIKELHEKMKELYRDIYEEEYEDFEITCPYCNYAFSADIDESLDEINCPECNNVIELDWNEEND